MRTTRRIFTAGLGTILAAGAAGCHGRVNRRAMAGDLDIGRLAREFPALAGRARPGIFNLGVMSLDGPGVWSAYDKGQFPLLGLFRLPVAAAALAEVDAGRLKLNERIRISAVDLSPPPSRIDTEWPTPPDGHVMMLPAADLIALSVQDNDNTAADVLMHRIGGPGAVTAWLRNKSIQEIRVDRYSREVETALSGLGSFRPEWNKREDWIEARQRVAPAVRQGSMDAYLADPRDTATAPGMLNFLGKLANGSLLSVSSSALLLRLMAVTSEEPGTRKDAPLRAGLPSDAAFAHETADSLTDLGFTPVSNDVGIATFAGGKRFAIAAFLAGSIGSRAQRDALFADAARLITRSIR